VRLTLESGIERRLDLPSVLQSARADPVEFLRHDGLMVIDEIQRMPELVLPIKAVVDQDSSPGQFLLTGTAILLGLRSLPDALVGRSETIELWPFARGELDRRPDGFVDELVGDEPEIRTSGSLLQLDYVDRALRGRFPSGDQTRGQSTFEVPSSRMSTTSSTGHLTAERHSSLRRPLAACPAARNSYGDAAEDRERQ